MNIKTIIICCCLILLWGCHGAVESNIKSKKLFVGEVTRVVSGQTIEVLLTGASEIERVRIMGIDAPDNRQLPWGKAAKQKLQELVQGKQIKIEAEDLVRDRYNRIQGHLWQDQKLVSQQLLESGCVLVNHQYPHSYSKLLMESQEYARLMGYGIWNPQQPMGYTPSQFRSMNPQ